MGETVAPSRGSKSAPSDAPSPHNSTPTGKTSSKPTDAPGVKRFNVSSTKGKTDPTLVSDMVPPVAAKAGSKDSHITRSI